MIGSAKNNSGKGIELDHSYSNLITRTTAFNNNYGIYLYESRNDSLRSNALSNNKYDGMKIYDSRNSSFIYNYLRNNKRGIYLTQVYDNRIQGNNASNNDDDGIFIDKSANNTILENRVEDNREIGIRLFSIDNSIIMDNNANDNIIGIALFNASYNLILGNRVDSNRKGLSFEMKSNNNTIIKNIAGKNGVGMALLDSTNNEIDDNNIINDSYGIAIQRSLNNVIINNNFSQNKICFLLNRSAHNLIGDSIFYHNRIGVALNFSANNTIKDRNFTDSEYNIIINENETISEYPLWRKIVIAEHPKDYLEPYRKGLEPFTETPIHPITMGSATYSSQSLPRLTVQMDSDPEGAEIRIDGETLNRTPGEIVLKGKGYHTIELALSGFESVNDVYYIEQSKKIMVKLTPIQPSHREKNASGFYIMMISTPRGASISIDEKRIGIETPSKLFFDSRGEHKFGLSLPGYRNYSGILNVSKDESLNVTLEPNATSNPNETPDSIWLSIIGIFFSYYIYKKSNH